MRLLGRSPGMLAVLVAYPLLVALLVALALQEGERRPSIALVNLDTSGRTVAVGETRLGVDDYAERLSEDVDLARLGPAEAEEALDDGRVSAVLTIPEGFISALQAGVGRPVVELRTSGRSPIESDRLVRRVESAVYRLNQGLAAGYVEQVLRLVDLVVEGGELGVFGRSGSALGLRRSRELVTDLQERLREEGDAQSAERLDAIVEFIDTTRANLDLARPAATAIQEPIGLEVAEAPAGRAPLSAFGVAGALLVSLGLLGVLMAAGAMSSEREDNALVRLSRGLVSPAGLVGAKTAFAAAGTLALGMALLVAVAAATSLTVGRWALWPPVLLIAGAAFGALGALSGAAARETRTALLAGLMLSVPLMALGLVPGSPVADALSNAVPFGPAFEAFRSLLAEPSLDGGALAARLGHLVLLAAVLGGAAALAVRRRSSAP